MNAWPPPQYAEALIPWWAVGLFALLVFALILLGHPRRVVAGSHVPFGACGPDWRVTRTRGGGYSAQTRGVLTNGTLQSCTFAVPAGSSRLVIHVGGDAVRMMSGAVGYYVPAGGWWGLPLQPGE